MAPRGVVQGINIDNIIKLRNSTVTITPGLGRFTKMIDFMDLGEDYNDISVRGAQRRGQKYHCNPTLSP